jgi:hypothetical protein
MDGRRMDKIIGATILPLRVVHDDPTLETLGAVIGDIHIGGRVTIP